jgi:hypothetical protein
MHLPKAIVTMVVTKLYADAKSLGWANLNSRQHSAQYAKWVDDPDVGGLIRSFTPEGDIRMWIKDGPMKEWSRAQSGVGKYTSLIEGAADTPKKLVSKVLGADWKLDESSPKTKPLRIVARKGADEIVLSWAEAKDLKHLVWAALTASAEGDKREWVICIVETLTKTTPANEKKTHERLAKRCGLRLTHVSL